MIIVIAIVLCGVGHLLLSSHRQSNLRGFKWSIFYLILLLIAIGKLGFSNFYTLLVLTLLMHVVIANFEHADNDFRSWNQNRKWRKESKKRSTTSSFLSSYKLMNDTITTSPRFPKKSSSFVKKETHDYYYADKSSKSPIYDIGDSRIPRDHHCKSPGCKCKSYYTKSSLS